MNTDSITKLALNARGMVVKNSPAILTGFGVLGLCTTVYSAIDATPKAMQILEERRAEELDINENFTDFTRWEMVKETWKYYIPTFISASITTACIISANSVNQRRNAALMGLYSLSENALKEYKSKVIETIGEKKNQEIRDSIAKDKIHNNPVRDTEILTTGHGDTLCYDVLSGRYFRSDIEHIRRSIHEINKNLLHDMYMSLNEVYSELDLPCIGLGELVGWNIDDGDVEPEFSSQLTDNDMPCLVVEFRSLPRFRR
jgi:hypothetical protein